MVDSQAVHTSHAGFCLPQITDKEKEALSNAVIARMLPMSETNVRIVLHCDVSKADVDKVSDKLRYVIAELGRHGRSAQMRENAEE